MCVQLRDYPRIWRLKMEQFDKTAVYNEKLKEKIDELFAEMEKAGMSFILLTHIACDGQADCVRMTSAQGEHDCSAVMGLCQRMVEHPEEADRIITALRLQDAFAEQTQASLN
jgi:hypothetical protein